MEGLKELKNKYWTDVFKCKNTNNHIVTYEKKYKNKKVIVKGYSDYTSELEEKELLSGLDYELNIFEIKEL